MRLEKLRLSGFKSFVDPTTVDMPGSLIGIVGPNGCGKSNIIDAVRWVMGESSAKHLRGGSMTDVIFNGSVGRKPIAQASVELVFDNSDASLGGEYATYSTLAIKRQINREGQSTYYLNGSRCRRKDIVDIFLGTGLGPRSYAVIEQGTISRLIEAKPEEMRVFIEEAAGISKYKERRHETEVRMRHTRENLERLTDLRDEVDKQVSHLQRQADKALKFKHLRDEERSTRKQLLAMRWQAYDQEFQQCELKIEESAETVNHHMLAIHELDKALDLARSEHKEAQQTIDQAQATFYSTSAELARIEQAIQHQEATDAAIQIELQQLHASQQQSSAETETDSAQINQIHQDRASFSQQLEELLELKEELHDLQYEAQQALQQWNDEWDLLRQELSSKQSAESLSQQRVTQATLSISQLQERQQRAVTEQQQAQADDRSEFIEQLQEESEILDEEYNGIQVSLLELDEQQQTIKQQISAEQVTLNLRQQQLQTTKGKISSLETLQKAALGDDNESLQQWLEQQQLLDAPRLAMQIEVESGWETAVEAVLGAYVEAICVESNKCLLKLLPENTTNALAIIEKRQQRTQTSLAAEQLSLPLLRDKIKTDWSIDAIFANVYCVDSEEKFSHISEQLLEHQSIISSQGLWAGQGWLLQSNANTPTTGVLKREKDLKELRTTLLDLDDSIAICQATIERCDTQLSTNELDIQQRRVNEKNIAANLLEKNTSLANHRAHQQQQNKRLEQIATELDGLKQQIDFQQQQLTQESGNIAELALNIEQLQQRYTAMESERDSVYQRAQQTTQTLQANQESIRQLESQLLSLDSTQQLALSQMERSQRQQQQSKNRIAELKQRMTASVEPLVEQREQLIDLHEQKAEHEELLSSLREQTSVLETQVTELSSQRNQSENSNSNYREALEKSRIEQQACLVRRQTVSEQLEELEEAPQTILATLPDDANIDIWEQTAEQLKNHIQRLGTVNLTAIEEVAEQSERLNFLNQQHQDLLESLESLEQAMEQIDNESKARFKETFDQINAGLHAKFPRLFGGGQARLDLTEDDLLSAGVKIMAQPPGKRNASIHLLSGGEKALTAVALVFSIFELNPAPFCLLDEVDAPLDDANVGRFGDLLKEMSNSVQFLIISHNKATMEVCQQMIGVTMKEPGVSRVVSVDVEQAVKMAVS